MLKIFSPPSYLKKTNQYGNRKPADIEINDR